MPVSLTRIPQQRPPLWRGVLPPPNLFRPTAQGEQPVPKGGVHRKERARFPSPRQGRWGANSPCQKVPTSCLLLARNLPPSALPIPPHRKGNTPLKGGFCARRSIHLPLSPRQGRWAGRSPHTRRPFPQKILSGCLPSARGPPLHARQEPYPAQGEGLLTGALAGTIPYRMPRAISIMLVRASSRSAEEMDCFSPFRVSEMVSRVAALLPLRAAL